MPVLRRDKGRWKVAHSNTDGCSIMVTAHDMHVEESLIKTIKCELT